MENFTESLFALACIFGPFIAMFFMWRRMKRIRTDSYEGREEPLVEKPWDELTIDEKGFRVGHCHQSSDELIGLGARAREGRWPLDRSN